MVDFATTILLIAGFFFLYLILRSTAKLQVCAICAAVSTTWLILLALPYTGTNINPLIVGILMGGSTVGLMYLLENKLSDKFGIFKLPFLLSLFTLIYILLSEWQTFPVIIILIIWIIFGMVFLFRNSGVVRDSAQKLIECCKNW